MNIGLLTVNTALAGNITDEVELLKFPDYINDGILSSELTGQTLKWYMSKVFTRVNVVREGPYRLDLSF